MEKKSLHCFSQTEPVDILEIKTISFFPNSICQYTCLESPAFTPFQNTLEIKTLFFSLSDEYTCEKNPLLLQKNKSLQPHKKHLYRLEHIHTHAFVFARGDDPSFFCPRESIFYHDSIFLDFLYLWNIALSLFFIQRNFFSQATAVESFAHDF